MGHKFAQIAFTETVHQVQREMGSRNGYAAMDQGEDYNNLLGQREADFISARDSFYMASVSETGWPYVQHRGGPVGFMKVIDSQTIGFADFSGNRQYVSVGNFRKDDRVSLFFMDYPNRTRFKLLGRVSTISSDQTEVLAQLEDPNYRADVERGFLIHIEAFDWNCPQHITPRFTESQVEALMTPLIEENKLLKANPPPADSLEHPIGTGPLELVISGIRQLTPRIRAFEFRDPNGDPLPEVTAGSHLEIKVPLHNGQHKIVHYSISSNPARRDAYEIAVLFEPEGDGGSIAVHREFQLGKKLNCQLPTNNFAIDDDKPAVLIAGGVGITPIKAMSQHLKVRGSSFSLHYAGRTRNEMAYRDRLTRELGDNITLYYSSEDKRLNIQEILQQAEKNTVFYVCGPAKLIDAVIDTAASLNIDTRRVRFERFNATISVNARPVNVRLHRSDKNLTVNADQTILDAIIEAGIETPFSCRAGNCRTCAVKVLAGEPDHRDSALSRSEQEDQKLMCPCISRAKTDDLVLDI